MTALMDNNKDTSSREHVQRLFNKNVELENKRRKAAQARVPSDPNTWQNMRENYEAIILEDHEFSEQHDIEYALWQLHYRRIEELRALFNSALAAAGSATSQNGKAPVRTGPDRLTKIRTQFKTILSEATGFYHDLMLKIKAKYGFPLGCFSDDSDNQIPMSKDGNKTSEQKKGLISCHRCLIYLGDLARYKGLYGEGDSKVRDFAAASSYYMQASSLWPSSGNPHHQLAILSGYSNDELVSIYRYFRSLAVDNPFITARDNLIIAFEKNRQIFTLLVGDAKNAKVKLPPARVPGKGRNKGETRPPLKDGKVEAGAVKEKAPTNFEPLKAFITRFIRLNGVLFTRTSLETFDDVLSMVKNDLRELLSSGPNEEFNFGLDSAECRLAVVRMVAILIFTVYNVSKENENQSYADILQRSVLLQNAFTAVFEFMGFVLERCGQLNDPSSSYLLPGIMVFVEWLACHQDVAVGNELEEKQINARSFFWNKCVLFLNKILSSGYAFVNEDEDETCFSNMSKYDESETANLALPEDFELRGFIPLIPAQLILDFSRNHSFVSDVGNKDKFARVRRIVAAGKALANIVRIGQEGLYYDSKQKTFLFGVEPQSSNDLFLTNHLEPNFTGLSVMDDMAVGAVSQAKVGVDVEDEDEDDEVIVFKPFTGEKHIDDSSKMVSSSVLPSVGGSSKTECQNENGAFSAAHDSILQAMLSGGTKSSLTAVDGIVANGTGQFQQSAHPGTSKWPPEYGPGLNSLVNLNLMENGSTLTSGMQDKFGGSQFPYPQFVDAGASQNYSIQIPRSSVQTKFDSIVSSGASADGLSVKSSSILQPGAKRNPVARPSRHLGPPPGFGSVPSKVMDEPLYNLTLKNETPLPQMDDYSWLDGYQLPSSNQHVGISNHAGPTFHSMSKSNSSMGIADFPFPGKQVSHLQVQLENQTNWQDYQHMEHMKQQYQEQQHFHKGNQQPVGPPPQQHQGQSFWEDRYFV